MAASTNELAAKAKLTNTGTEDNRSYFDGGYFAYIGYHFLVIFVSLITLGIAFPWMFCVLQKWKAKHTVICGKRQYFDGTGIQLIGKYLLWSFLTAITFGIYGFWMTLAIKRWVCKHTHFVGEEDNNSYFDGKMLGFIGTNVLATIVLAVPVVGPAWSNIIKLKWEAQHTVTDSRRLVFTGAVGTFFVKYLLWGFLTAITFGIFGLFLPVKNLRLETENTIDNEHTTDALMEQSEYRNIVRTDCASFKSNNVEYEMEAIKAGINNTTGQEELLTLANQGLRAAQYLYVTRYANEAYTAEPFSSLLKSAAEAEYAPAMSLYALTHTVDTEVRNDLLTKAADKGQIPAIRDRMVYYANIGLATAKDKEALPYLKKAVRYGDLLIESNETMTDEEQALYKKCVLAIRRIKSALPPSKKGKVALIILLVLVGIPLILGLIVGAIALIRVPFAQKYDAVVGQMGANRGPETAAFWDEFSSAMENDYYDIEEIAAEDDETRAFQFTCNKYYWSSDYEVRITSREEKLYSVTIQGERILDPEAEEPTINEDEMENAIRVVYQTLGLGGFEDITPYTGTDGHTEMYGDWCFRYDNDDARINVTIFKTDAMDMAVSSPL